MDMIDRLFKMLDCDNAVSNSFQTAEGDRMIDEFHKRYICNRGKLKNQNEMFDCFMEVIVNERMQAFKVGFKTAVKMIFLGSMD